MMCEGIKRKRGPDTQIGEDGAIWSWESQKSFRKEDFFLWAFSQGMVLRSGSIQD